ncbi:MAG: lyase family protein, partial [Anaerotruncus massiliensis (ex Togo et al. 2019)]
LKLLGSKGTTGTQASFVELFDGDSAKIRAVEEDIAREMGFDAVVPVSGQTYSRKVDSMVVGVLAGIAQSASKFSNDLRILQNFKEMEEPFEAHQIGSSAMPYKRNPMRSERITALARYVMTDSLNPAFTAATQWFERTLDDSANKRVAVAEAFLATDAILGIMLNVCDGLVVYPKVVRQRVMKELPFMATENIDGRGTPRRDRQELHERLREHSMLRAARQGGGRRQRPDRASAPTRRLGSEEEVDAILDPARFTGRSAEQVEEYLRDVVNPVLEANRSLLGERAQLSV